MDMMQDEKQRRPVSQWFPDSEWAKHLPLSQFVAEHNGYLSSKLKRTGLGIKSELRGILNSVPEKNETTLTESKKESDLLQSLNAMPLHVLSTYVHKHAEDLGAAHTALDRKRSDGVRKTWSETERFVMQFDRFLNAYSGILDIVKTADAQYGGVAGATLALLFSTVKLKIKNEEAIVSAMEQISDRLPDLEVYRKIYPEPKLGLMLVDAYKDIIILARAATSYFLGSTWGRQVINFGNPLSFEVLEQNMRENFRRIRIRCDVLLAQRVDQLANELKDSYEREDRTRVVLLRDALNIGSYRTGDAVLSLKQYRKALASSFDDDRHRSKLCKSDLMTESKARFWQESTSCLLMLSGCNEEGVGEVALSWLSPVAVDIVLDRLSQSRPVAFEICTRSSTWENVLARLIFQLLEKNPAVVRKGQDWYEIQSHIAWDGDSEGKTKHLSEALRKIVDLQTEEVYIVIDRPELSEDDSVRDFASGMLHLIEQTRNVLRAMIIHRAELWNWEENKRSVLGKGMRGDICQALRIDQCRLESN
ncbi:hypothetical protein BKA58DRAFT_433709 [Alternaria rosae]|uniref:uncharacterized protein n=1 Tax=Alternaria rosae TaxID=1187941 RepID=UPI001E8CB203|nr:uncharacterized protein BKA58DRAFT_433709 [Alternaria rosae]KAH6881928.1 hypothetical protein BKA58DRAFT_433709 [Alternaria rosae]